MTLICWMKQGCATRGAGQGAATAEKKKASGFWELWQKEHSSIDSYINSLGHGLGPQ